MTRILALLAALAALIALWPRKSPAVTSWDEPEDAVQPTDPYSASLLQ
jgi:hypothetical protein